LSRLRFYRRRRQKLRAIRLGDRARNHEQWALAASLYENALASDPTDSLVWASYGHAMREAGNLAEAEMAYRSAISYDDGNIECYVQLGRILTLVGKKQQAVEVSFRALALDPKLDEQIFEFARPSPWQHYLFDPDWYVRQLPSEPEPGTIPLLDYLRSGVYELKSPHPLFDPDFYIAQWQRHEPHSSVTNVFDHYLRQGRQLDIATTPLFSPAWYRRQYLTSSSEDTDPLQHYLTTGYLKNFKPHPLFDESWYRDHAPGITDKTPGLVDYVVRGAQIDLDPHPLFKTEYIKSQNKSFPKTPTPLETYLSQSTSVDPHPLFSTSHYLDQSTSPGEITPLEHYLEQGWRRGLDPHPFFRGGWYLKMSTDARERAFNPLFHYETVGRQAGQRPNPFFEPLWYAAANLDANCKLTAEQHYLHTGFARGLSGRNTGRLHSGALIRSKAIPHISIEETASLPSIQPDRKLGVFLHAFYPALTEEIFTYVNNLPQPSKVFISTDTEGKARAILRIADQSLKHPHEIRVLPNRGRDIAPWLVGFSDRMREVDFAVHLHTKRSPHGKDDLTDWRRYLFDGLVGSPQVVEGHLKILNYQGVGATLLQHFHPLLQKGNINWGHNFDLVRDLTRLCNVDVSDQIALEFPSGSMFWFKPRALAPLLELNLCLEMFEPETGQVDGTLAHAIERSFLYVIEAAGYGWVRVSSDTDLVKPAGWETFNLTTFLANGGARILRPASQAWSANESFGVKPEIKRGVTDRGTPHKYTEEPDTMANLNAPDEFSHEAPSIQNSVSIFSNWTSVLPIQNTNVGSVPLFDARQDPRVSFVVRAFGSIEGFNILELGSFEGGHSYQLEKFGARSILAIEANPESYLKSLIIKEALGLKARFMYGDFIKYLEDSQEYHDLIFAAGVLCHMADPLHLLRLITGRTSRTFIWTQYVGDVWNAESYDVERYGVECRYHRFDYEPEAPGRSYSGTEAYCCRLKKEDIIRALRSYGFKRVEIVQDDPHSASGANMSLVASA
jgi:hypothetical protein